MTTICHDIAAPCAPERVWAVLADLEAVQRYNPMVRSAMIEGSVRTGIGARRVCELAPRGRVVERVTHWDEPRAIGLEVAESDWPIHFMRWITEVQPRDDGGSRIVQRLEYRVKLGPLGWLLDKLVMKRKLRRTLDTVFAQLVAEAGTRSIGRGTE